MTESLIPSTAANSLRLLTQAAVRFPPGTPVCVRQTVARRGEPYVAETIGVVEAWEDQPTGSWHAHGAPCNRSAVTQQPCRFTDRPVAKPAGLSCFQAATVGRDSWSRQSGPDDRQAGRARPLAGPGLLWLARLKLRKADGEMTLLVIDDTTEIAKLEAVQPEPA